MISLLFAIGTFSAYQVDSRIDWVRQALASVKVSGARSLARPHPLITVGEPIAPGPWRRETPGPPNDPQLLWNIERGDAAVRHTADLIELRRFKEAYSYISTVRRAKPELEPFVEGMAVHCELLSGHYQQALSDTAERIKMNSRPDADSGMDPDYLCLSLAASGLGRGYLGQWEFCARKLREYNWTGEALSLPATPDPKKLMAMSALTLAMGAAPFSQQYFELALKVDPTNELAARLVVEYDEVQGKYSDLRRIASTQMSKLPAGETREFLRARMLAAAGLADRPKFKRAESK